MISLLQLDYTFSVAEDVIKVSDHLYITEEVIPRPTSELQDHSWTLKVRRVPGPIPDTGEEHPVTRPHFNFNTSGGMNNGGGSPSKNFPTLYSQLSQHFGLGSNDYDDEDLDDADDIGDEAVDQRFNNYQNIQEFKEEPELNDDE